MQNKRQARRRLKKENSPKLAKNRKGEDGKVFNKRFVGFLCILALLIFLVRAFNHPYLQVSQIYVNGNERLKDTDVISYISNPIGKNILTYNSKKNEKKLLKNDMIAEAKIKKVFPKIININISEVYPRFFIEDGDKITYISNHGQVLDKENISKNIENSLIKIKLDDYEENPKEDFTKDYNILEFIKKINASSYADLISQLNFENKAHIGIMIKDMKVDFGDLKDSSYKIKLLESILKDIESKNLDVSSINLKDGKKPVVEINQGS